MAQGKKLKQIAVWQADGNVGMSLQFDNQLQDHYILPVDAAEQLRDRLSEACQKARQPKPAGQEVTNDRVAVSEHVSLSLTTPSTQEH